MAENTAVKVSRELRAISDELSARLDGVAGEHVAFSLFVWTKDTASYIASAGRTQVIPVLEQMIARWKAGVPDVPAHEVQ